MRRPLLYLALFLVAGGVLYQFLSGHQGFILVSVGPYVIETSLWVAVLIVLVLALVARLLSRLYGVLLLPGNWLNWQAGKRRQRFRTRTLQGVVDYIEGNWPRAISNLKRAAGQSDMPVVNYLGAAASSFQLGDYPAAEIFLDQAEASGNAAPFTTGLLRARLRLQRGDFDRALPLVQSLHRQNPTHPTVLRLLASARKGLRDWGGLEALLPDLKKHRALTRVEFTALEEEVYAEIIAAFPGDESKNTSLAELQNALDRLWDEVPRRLQRNTRLLVLYVQQLQRIGSSDKAESRLRRYLNKHWDETLVELYGNIRGNPGKQLAAAESWLAGEPDNATLLRTLGRLCVRAELWGKARDYYERSLASSSQPRTYYDLAELLLRLNEHSASAKCYQEGLKLAVSRSH